MHRHESDFVALPFDAEVYHALAALDVAHPEPAELLAPDAVVKQGGEDARSRTPLSVSPGGASSSLRAWASPSAGVLPSLLFTLGRLTPSTGFPATALCSQR